MIKERHLVPGRVLLRLSGKRVPKFNKDGHHIRDEWVNAWRPCMVVAYYPDISRRHARKTAPISGWEVLVIWWGPTARPIEHVRIVPERSEWKPAPF